MTWFKVDDTFAGHPKVLDLADGPCFAQAVALWTMAGTWSAAQLTDGIVPALALKRLVPFDGRRAAAELVRVGLWAERTDGYAFHDWHHYQPTKAEKETEMTGSARRSRKYREKKKDTERGEASRHASVTRDDTVAPNVRHVAPSRPVPTRPSPDGDVPRAPDPEPVVVEPPKAPTAAEHAPTDRMLRSFDSERHPEIIALVSETRQAAGGAPFVCRSHTDRDSVSRLAEWAGRPEIGVAAAGVALRAFYAAKGTAARLSWLVEEDPGRYLGKTVAKVRKGEHRPALPNDCYSTDMTDLDQLLGGGQ